jgi:maleylpyruvate isomerase
VTTAIPAVSYVDEGTALLLDALARLDGAELDAPCALPDWTRRHLLAHVASNAEALRRLLSWARTGVENRMYASPEQRAADIETGAARPAAELRAWVRDSADALADDMATLPAQAWSAQVVTAQGRIVPASEVPWIRAREVCVHVVDLGSGVTFADLPEAFCVALLDDVTRWRGARPGSALELVTPDGVREVPGEGAPRRVELPLADAAAWMTGRGDRPGLPALPRWL